MREPAILDESRRGKTRTVDEGLERSTKDVEERQGSKSHFWGKFAK